MNDWKKARLTDVAQFINGYAFKPSDFSETGVPIVRIEQLKNPNGSKYDYYIGKIPDKNCINNNDLIFSWSASLFLRIWQNDFAYLNQHLFKVIPNSDIDKNFLKFLLEAAIEDLVKKSHGSTMQHITRKELQKFDVSFPIDILEQSRIASILVLIEKAIEKTEHLITKNKGIKAGLIQDLFRSGIDENGNIRNIVTHEFKDSPVGLVPKEWTIKPLKEIISYISYGFTNPMPTTESGPYMVTATNIFDGYIQYDTCRFTSQSDFNNLLTAKSKPQKGDLLITKDGTLGRLAVVENSNLCINQSVAVLRVKKELVDVVFLKKLLESPYYQKRIHDDSGGSTIKHIYITKLDKMFIALPSCINEQNRIISTLNEVDKILNVLKLDLNKLNLLKTGLMQDLLSGKVRVETSMNQPIEIV